MLVRWRQPVFHILGKSDGINSHTPIYKTKNNLRSTDGRGNLAHLMVGGTMVTMVLDFVEISNIFAMQLDYFSHGNYHLKEFSCKTFVSILIAAELSHENSTVMIWEVPTKLANWTRPFNRVC